MHLYKKSFSSVINKKISKLQKYFEKDRDLNIIRINIDWRIQDQPKPSPNFPDPPTKTLNFSVRLQYRLLVKEIFK